MSVLTFGSWIGGSLKKGFWANETAKHGFARNGKRTQKFKPSAFAVLTSDNTKEGLTMQVPQVDRRNVDPKNLEAIILGGGDGTELFPLTRRAATPAVPIGGCYRLIDISMSNCINSGINKIFVLTQFNSASLNRHVARTYFGNGGINFGGGFVEIFAATQTSGESGMEWFQGTADAVRQFIWIFEDAKNRNIENVLILSGNHLYKMDYVKFMQSHVDSNADITISCALVDNSRASDYGIVKMDSRGKILQFIEKCRNRRLVVSSIG